MAVSAPQTLIGAKTTARTRLGEGAVVQLGGRYRWQHRTVVTGGGNAHGTSVAAELNL